MERALQGPYAPAEAPFRQGELGSAGVLLLWTRNILTSSVYKEKNALKLGTARSIPMSSADIEWDSSHNPKISGDIGIISIL